MLRFLLTYCGSRIKFYSRCELISITVGHDSDAHVYIQIDSDPLNIAYGVHKLINAFINSFNMQTFNIIYNKVFLFQYYQFSDIFFFNLDICHCFQIVILALLNIIN